MSCNVYRIAWDDDAGTLQFVENESLEEVIEEAWINLTSS